MSQNKEVKMTILELLRSDGSIVVNKKLARALGIDVAIMYSELISKYFYFETRGQLTDDGYFFNTIDNMEEDTCLSKYQQTKAIKVLVVKGLIKHQNRGLPQKRFFKITYDEQKLVKILDMGKKSKNLTIRSEESKDLKVKELNSNNTKVNNTNINNTKVIKRYTVSLGNSECKFLSFYNETFKQYMGKEHPLMTDDKYEYVESKLNELRIDNSISDDEMYEFIDRHFDEMSDDNDGKIYAFIDGKGSSSVMGKMVRGM